jgi:hypothetical protein
MSVVEFFSHNMKLLGMILGGLGAAFLILKAKAVGAAIASGAAWALSLLPIVLLAALIAAVILVVEDLWQWFTGGESVLKDLRTWFVDAFVGWIEAAERELRVFISWVTDKIDDLADKLLGFLGQLNLGLGKYGVKVAMNVADQEQGKARGSVLDADQAIAQSRRAAFLREATGLDTFPFAGGFGGIEPTLPVSATMANQVEIAPRYEQTFNITSPSADPAMVAEEARRVIREENDRANRELATTLGVP